MLALLAAAAVLLHPLHTTYISIVERPATHDAIVTVRVFQDDFGRALAQRAGGRRPAGDPGPAEALAYLRETLTLAGPDGAAVPLSWIGWRREADAIVIALRAMVPRGLAGLAVRSRLHCELYDDQVNVVRVESGGRRTTLLFTADAPPQRVPLWSALRME